MVVARTGAAVAPASTSAASAAPSARGMRRLIGWLIRDTLSPTSIADGTWAYTRAVSLR